MAAEGRHTGALMRIPGVVGTAVALVKGKAAVRIFVERADVRGLPSQLDGMPVDVKVTGRFMALSDPTTRQRPAPLGYSVGHPAITAGSIGGGGPGRGGGPFLPPQQPTAPPQQKTRHRRPRPAAAAPPTPRPAPPPHRPPPPLQH